MPLLEIEGLSKRFGGLKAVDDVSFQVSKGMIKSVIGPNGAGKTTLFNLISGFLPSDAGKVSFRDQPILGIKPHRAASVGLARTFQNIRLFPQMTVLENVMIGRHTHTRSGFISGMLHLPWTRKETRKAREACLEVMTLLGINEQAGKEAVSLAYGQQRVVELARAMACEPTLLLLDEPAAGLNMRETEEVSELIVKIRERDVTLLIVEHDMSLVMNISDEILVLSYGQVIADDHPQAVQNDPEVIRVYLGEEDAED